MRNLRFILLLALFMGLPPPVFAQEAAPKIRVGIFDRPPFAMKAEDGSWKGIAVDLWEDISRKLGISYEYVEVPLDQIITQLSQGKIDLAIGEIGVTAERERLVDFTQPYLVDPAAVAFHKGDLYPTFKEVYNQLVQHGLLIMLLIMMGTLAVFSFVLWLCERGVHQTHFGGKPIHGFGSAIWFGAVTMTTVGYGDKTPQSPMGRFLAFLWMFFSIVLVCAFTGVVASSLTISHLDNTIDHPSDLRRFSNGVQHGSVGEELLKKFRIPTRSYATIEEGMQALAEKKITAFVGDTLSLHYLVNRDYDSSIRIASFSSINVTLAMAMRPDFPRYDEINLALIEIVQTDDWLHTVKRWIGSGNGVSL